MAGGRVLIASRSDSFLPLGSPTSVCAWRRRAHIQINVVFARRWHVEPELSGSRRQTKTPPEERGLCTQRAWLQARATPRDETACKRFSNGHKATPDTQAQPFSASEDSSLEYITADLSALGRDDLALLRKAVVVKTPRIDMCADMVRHLPRMTDAGRQRVATHS